MVKNGFEVLATGDVEIDGNLEGTAKTDGSIQVKKGIIRGNAIAGGCIFARYIENSQVESRKDVVVSEAVMHSNLKAEKKIMVGGRKGLLVGGTACAGEEISAKNIGSNVGTMTLLEVGMRPALRQEYKDISRQLIVDADNYEKANKYLLSLNELKQKLGGNLPRDKADLLNKLTRGYIQISQSLEELNKRKQELDVIFMEMNKARVCIENTIYIGVNINMGKAIYIVQEEMRRVAICLDRLDICVKPLR
jgi:hypothetical protein